MKVNTKPLRISTGNANSEFHAELAKINGNKLIRVVLEGQPAPIAQDENILLAITSQKDETGTDVTAFTYDDQTQLLTPTAGITNILSFGFEHLITYLGSASSGGNNDANDVIEVIQRIVDNNTAPASISEREVDKLSSALNLPNGETIQVPKTLSPDKPSNPTQDLAIDSNISIGWALKSFNNPVITCSAIRIVLDVIYYDINAIGGN